MSKPVSPDTASRIIAVFARIAGQNPVVNALSCTPWASLGRNGQRQCFTLQFGVLELQKFLDKANVALAAVSIDSGRQLIADWSFQPVHENPDGTSMVFEMLILIEP